jgi:cobalamin biosynthesis Co2+ chelatase CbiK
MANLEKLFSDEALAMLEGFPAVHAVATRLIEHDIPAARLLAYIVAMAEHRGDEIDALRHELGLRPMAHERLGRIKPASTLCAR